MQRGLVTMPDGVVYYYDVMTGALQRNVVVTVDGVNYQVDGNGVAVPIVAEALPAAEQVPGQVPEQAPGQIPADGAAVQPVAAQPAAVQ